MRNFECLRQHPVYRRAWRAPQVHLAGALRLFVETVQGRSRSRPLRPDWEQVKDDIMRQAVLRKFETRADICEVLLSAGDAIIVENAPRDYY